MDPHSLSPEGEMDLLVYKYRVVMQGIQEARLPLIIPNDSSFSPLFPLMQFMQKEY